MLILGLISWWYGAGWFQLVQRVFARVNRTFDFFSIELLLKTLLSPYRQISAGRVNGPIGLQLRAWFDRQISRVIGAVVRLIVIIVGLAAALAVIGFGALLIICWPLLPALPFIAAAVVFGVAR